MPPAVHRRLVVVMGVTGSGKSTVGAALAQRLGCAFVDGDSLHSAANVAKMTAGTPLDDADREPWLRAVGQQLARADGQGRDLVVACSALRRAYRQVILAEAPAAVFVLLQGSVAELRRRLAARSGHFMPATLLDSQLATLEPLGPDEPGVTVSIDQGVDTGVDAVVEAALGALSRL